MLNGVIPIWKEKGLTSHDVVFKLRKILKQKRIGHTGTLDPQVEGVLLVCLGEGTKLVELLMDGEKTYVGEITLGQATETEDRYGAIIATKRVQPMVEQTIIDATMEQFKGWINQIPPYYSAVKVQGKKLYEYARAGIEVERPSRQVFIHAFERTSEINYDEQKGIQSWTFEVICGKGTYVRTLAVDLGKQLGYPAHMSALTRKATGGFDEADAVTLGEVQQAMDENQIDRFIFPIEALLRNFPTIDLSQEEYHDVRHGKVLAEDYFGKENLLHEITVLCYRNKVVALYQPHPNKEHLIKPYRMFTHTINE
ncbi:tRNA pseudouridine(55) synthase TruB [Fundicoccus culcitae]|uniref:tRNA pseudouridine synthase B n=1 Tax=Fundicoccus culcitae TaxID=2969821 RepID=A0ABY5P7B1_9LACT|nr:tRNA pseudouridine(55) synthase TruB [Fundicoccus culcitae]UUX34622.1 tRNA pseudouridine(55) synthase TruB [Fundicoccus culcitae]